MCKLGDIIVVKNFKGEDGTLLKKKIILLSLLMTLMTK